MLRPLLCFGIILANGVLAKHLFIPLLEKLMKSGKNMEAAGMADCSMVPPCGRGEVVMKKCFPKASKTPEKNERLDLERD